MPATEKRKGLAGLFLRIFGWLKSAQGFYSLVVTMLQLLPAALALLAVTLSPTAWLSATLRRWVAAGVLVGTVVGISFFAFSLRKWWLGRGATVTTAPVRAAGPRAAIRQGSGKAGQPKRVGAKGDEATIPQGTPPLRRLRNLAVSGLAVAALGLVLLRVHFAVVDVGSLERYPLLTPVFDFYLGGAGWRAASYNVVAALLAAAAVAGLVVGGPAAAIHHRERRRALAALALEGGPIQALDRAADALSTVKTALDLARASIIELTDERDSLRERLSQRESDAEP